SDVPYIKTGSAGFLTWTVEEVRQFERDFQSERKPALPLACCCISVRAGPTVRSLAVSMSVRPGMVAIWPSARAEPWDRLGCTTVQRWFIDCAVQIREP